MKALEQLKEYWHTEGKQGLWGGFLLLGVPVIIYFIIKWDPVLFRDYENEPITLGMLIVIILYWVALFYIHKDKSRR